MKDVYGSFSNIFDEQITKKQHYGILNLPTISLENAIAFTVSKEYEYRPDLISLFAYGSIDFDDFITIANKLTDPIKDYSVGRQLFLPAPEVLADYIK
jgi:hypothetical protein